MSKTKNYTVYIKSGTELPDYEREFTSDELHRCQISWADDVDEEGNPVGTKCGGRLVKLADGSLECQSCKTIYAIQK